MSRAPRYSRIAAKDMGKIRENVLFEDVSGNLGEKPKGKDLKR
jgi:hypothetical protein